VGTFAGLLMESRGLRVGVLEAGAREDARLQPLIIGGDTHRMFTAAGATGLPALDPKVSSPSGYVPICDLVRSVRDAGGARTALVMRYHAPVDAVERTADGVAVTAAGERFEAPVLFDFTGGKLHAGDAKLGLQTASERTHAAAVAWSAKLGLPSPGAIGVDDAARARVELDGIRAGFVGHRDAERGTFGTIQFDQRPSAEQRARIASALQAKLGLADGAPDVLSGFVAANRIAPGAWDRGVALGGDSVATYRPRKSIGLRTGVWDAPDAADLAVALARPPVDPATSYGAHLRGAAIDKYTSAVMKRHRDALHTDEKLAYDF
jgi:hypothetical protein